MIDVVSQQINTIDTFVPENKESKTLFQLAFINNQKICSSNLPLFGFLYVIFICLVILTALYLKKSTDLKVSKI